MQMFVGTHFKMWQQKMFYHTTLGVTIFWKEVMSIITEDEPYISVRKDETLTCGAMRHIV